MASVILFCVSKMIPSHLSWRPRSGLLNDRPFLSSSRSREGEEVGGAGGERKAVGAERRGGVAEGDTRFGEGGGEGRGDRGVGYRYDRYDDGCGKSAVAGEDASKEKLRAKEEEEEEREKERLKEARGRRVLNSLDLVETLVSCRLPSLSPAGCS